MTDSKRRSSNALPLQSAPDSPSAPSRARGKTPDLRSLKIEAERLREKLQKSVIDNPHVAKKSAYLISLWIEGKTKAKQKKAG
jgi:hypothetical protein